VSNSSECLPNRGRLRNGNPSGDFSVSPRCNALTRKFSLCRAPGVRLPSGEYSRCRMHGGAAALRNWKHGQFAAASQEECAAIQAAIRHTVDLIRQASQAPVRDSPDANL
jgi:hypothetical protein